MCVPGRSEEHTSELQSRLHLVCRLLLEKKKSSCVLETERLTLRRPTIADVKAIARLANARRIAENTRRLPHPYSPHHAIFFFCNDTATPEIYTLSLHDALPI